MSQFNLTLPLQQKRKLMLPGAWACRPELIPKGAVRWRQPPRADLVSTWCPTCASSPTSKNPKNYAAFPPDSVQLRSTLPVRVRWSSEPSTVNCRLTVRAGLFIGWTVHWLGDLARQPPDVVHSFDRANKTRQSDEQENDAETPLLVIAARS